MPLHHGKLCSIKTICAHCQGRGIVTMRYLPPLNHYTNDQNDPRHTFTTEVICENCDGTGMVELDFREDLTGVEELDVEDLEPISFTGKTKKTKEPK
jgi:RecJ-like exonuclease